MIVRLYSSKSILEIPDIHPSKALKMSWIRKEKIPQVGGVG
jgi:hypothetical protein